MKQYVICTPSGFFVAGVNLVTHRLQDAKTFSSPDECGEFLGRRVPPDQVKDYRVCEVTEDGRLMPM